MLIFHQITKFFWGKCARIKKLDMKWIEIALEYCTFTFISSLERKRSNFNGVEETIANFQWFLRRPLPLNIFWQSDHCYQWFFNGF